MRVTQHIHFFIILNKMQQFDSILSACLKTNVYFVAYYSMFRSIFSGIFVHINPVHIYDELLRPVATNTTDS